MDQLKNFLARFDLDKLKNEPAVGLAVVGVLAGVKDRSIHLLALAGVAWWIYTPPPELPAAVDDAAAVKAAAMKEVKAAAGEGKTKEELIEIWNRIYKDRGIAQASQPDPPASKPQLLDSRTQAAAFDGSDDKAPGLAKG